MKALARASWLILQLASGLFALAWFVLARRGCPLLLTHHQDRDARGRDQQMGVLLDALAPRCIEVARVPLTRASLGRAVGARPCLPYAAIVVVARMLAPFARDRARVLAVRTRVVRMLLRLLHPPVVFLIDESGSGQPFVRASRGLGIRSVGIQHGDFAPGSVSYDRTVARDVVAADVLCVWSEWFRARLLAISSIYTAANTRVTGRLRPDAGAAATVARETLAVAVLGEANAEFDAAISPFVAALRADPSVVVEVHPHPAIAAAPRDLVATLRWCDVALGMRSSALLEALWWRRPIVVVDAGDGSNDWAAAGVAVACRQPSSVVAVCRAAARECEGLARARATVWGAPPGQVCQTHSSGSVAQVLEASRGPISG